MTKRLFNFIILLILGLLTLTSSILTFKNDTKIDLSKAKYTIGQVTYADTREIRNFTLKYPSFKKVFYFKLNNSNENFAVHRSYEGYEDLKTAVEVGDTIKVYFRHSSNTYNLNVFQLEKKGKVLEDYKNYSESQSSKAGIGLFIGILLTIGSILWYKKFNLLKFMTGLVER
jgi:hypothetical protein